MLSEKDPATYDLAELSVLSPQSARTLAALAEAIFPADEAAPGAVQIGVVTYIDRALLEPYKALRPLYRQGLEALDGLARETAGQAFADLAEDRRAAVLRQIDGLVCRRAPQDEPGSTIGELERFFAVVRQHVMEGLFGDPLYGGNRAKAGWRMIGFPGAQWGYEAEAQRPGFDASTLEPLSLAELRAQRRKP